MDQPSRIAVRDRWKPRAEATNNGDFIGIETYSSHSLALADPLATEYLLAPDAPVVEVGQAVVQALKQSRFLSFDEEGELLEKTQENYKAWVQKLMDLYGYKNKRALFKNMQSCSIQLSNGKIEIHPSHHDKLEGWGGDGFTEKDYVYVPVDAPFAEIGKALLLAFSRCTG